LRLAAGEITASPSSVLLKLNFLPRFVACKLVSEIQ
jgi:hypothetical protein